MWKNVTRTIREAIEKRINILRIETSSRDKCRQICSSQCKWYPLINQRFEDLQKNIKQNSPPNFHDGAQQQKEQRGEKWDGGHHLCQGTWLGALGWSSAVVLGWYLTQPLCWRRKVQPSDTEAHYRLRTRGPEYIGLTHILTKVALNQPLQHILPQHRDSSPCLEATEEPRLSYGPLTAEKALDEAVEDFARAQDSVAASQENRLGVACMQLGQQGVALSHFSAAAKLGHPAAAFNLGLCYEMGLGTPQDLKQAAQWYRQASELGHANAMYNLGVFHVHGWGGVSRDAGRARQLFVSASQLGQMDATRALGMVRPPRSPTETLLDVLGVTSKDRGTQDDLTEVQHFGVKDDVSELLHEAVLKYTNII